MKENSEEKILSILKGEEYRSAYKEKDKLPQPYCLDKSKVKVIILGCDPTADRIVNKEKNIYFDTVFGLSSIDKKLSKDLFKKEYNYFGIIQKNLDALMIKKDEIYVQNLCKNYFKKETSKFGKSKTSPWVSVAKLWIENLKEELSQFDNEIPILLTAQILTLPLTGEIKRAKDNYYGTDVNKVIKAENNQLNRTLIPFYRYGGYSLKLEANSEYKEFITKIINQN